MGMLLAVLGGFLAVVLGILGLIFWFGKFILLLQGTLPLVLILGSVFGLGITDLDVNQVIDGIITIVVALGTISTAIITVSGIVRKIKIRKADQ